MNSIIETPPLLAQTYQPPKRLYLSGQFNPAQQAVAIVGSRRASEEGRQTAYQLARELAGYGLNVISGLAVGIDRSAHEGALSGGGTTTAVLPGGIKNVYPSSHAGLAKAIIQAGGGLISETSGDSQPHKHDFLARNRIIAGLSVVTIVVEAAERSGALSTARHALEAGREVMAVPGSLHSPLSAGTNRLIRQGAHILVETADVLSLLGIEPLAPQEPRADSAEELSLIKLLGGQILSVDELLAASGLPVAKAMSTISEMEIKGALEILPGNLIKSRVRLKTID